MIYLAVFAITYVLSLVYVRRFATLRAAPLVSRGANGRGFVLHPQKAVAILFFLLTVAPLFLLSALREGIGTDYYYTYTPRFLEILAGERTYYEIGFYYFNLLIGVFTSDPQWVFIVTSLIFCVGVFVAFEQEGEDLPFCVLLLLVSGEYFISLNNLRQAIASAVILYAYKYVRRKQWLHFGIIVAVMATLHKSMILFIPILALFILAEYVSYEKIFITIAVCAAAGFVLLNAAPELLKTVLPERLQYYIENAMYTEPTIGFPRIVLNVGVLVFLLFSRYRSQGDKRRDLDPFILVQLLAVVICLFDNLIPAAYRVLRILTFWQLLAIPKAVALFKEPDRRVVKVLLCIVLGAMCFYAIVILGTEEILPYHSIFHT